MAITTGYSGTPLAKKLGIKSGHHVLLVNAPGYYLSLFDDMPNDVVFGDVHSKPHLVHFFVLQKELYLTLLPQLKQRLQPNGAIWVSWPKKSSKVVCDVTEGLVRNYAIEIGLVDIKVCAGDEIWSGLKLVIPVKYRLK